MDERYARSHGAHAVLWADEGPGHVWSVTREEGSPFIYTQQDIERKRGHSFASGMVTGIGMSLVGILAGIFLGSLLL